MTINVGINGFGRMGRLVLRALFDHSEFTIRHINDPAGSATSFAHLLTHDSVHGTWRYEAISDGDSLCIGQTRISTSHHEPLASTDWSACDVVVEGSGKFLTGDTLCAYTQQGVSRVVVTAPVKDEAIPDIVMGVNDDVFRAQEHPIVTAASCTTNCVAPVIKVLLSEFDIKHGAITTIHDLTNTQRILDTHHKDLRRARASSLNLIPTTTGSARAITRIFPNLVGKLDGHAVRVPLANASLTDCVFELSQSTTVAHINALFKAAAHGELHGILGYEERPLVSTDFCGDPRSCIVDAPSTLVVDDTLLKLYCWYDNEWGYAQRVVDLVRKVTGLEARQAARQ